jgi:hypothetical protein
VYGRCVAPSEHDIKQWYDLFMETGGVMKATKLERPHTSEAQVEAIREVVRCTSTKLFCHTSWKLQVPLSTIDRVLCKHLKLYACRVKIVQAV